MKVKPKYIILLVLVGFAILAAAFLLLRKQSTETKNVKVVEHAFSVCTMDVPSSTCGAYDVKVELESGEQVTYKVPGFNNRDSKHYEEVSSKIDAAKDQNTTISINVNKKGEITSIQ